MPELPEVEVLVRHLRPQLLGRRIRAVTVRRRLVLDPTTPAALTRVLVGATFGDVRRRGKFLLFSLTVPRRARPVLLVGHLGMTGRMYLAAPSAPLAKHAAVVLDLGGDRFILEDTRYFGRLTLDTTSLERLGPEPLEAGFNVEEFGAALARSAQAIKVKLLDQSLVAGVGNIYASEALFRAGVRPGRRAGRLTRAEAARVALAVGETLDEALAAGGSSLVDYRDAEGREGGYQNLFRVYDREGLPCLRCASAIRHQTTAGRSTYYCPSCQR